MKAAVSVALLFFVTQAFGELQLIAGSESPDKHYRVSVERTDARICYRIDGLPSGHALLRIDSSYQPEKGAEDWAYRQSLGAEVHWRKDTNAVAIDESNHRGMGAVLLIGRQGKGFRYVPVDWKALMHSTGEPWDRGRPFFSAWGTGDTVILALVGRLYFQDGNRFEESGWLFTLDLSQNGKVFQKEKNKGSPK
ncbi:MAG: hypothetical protein WCH57_03230 [Verrucomicrobiota bacterium]